MTPTNNTLLLTVLLIATSVTQCYAVEKESSSADDTKTMTGYNCLFIGHSFFIPVAKQLPPYVQQKGFTNHRQQHVFAAGAAGAPGALWNSDKRKDIEQKLATGTIDVLGMTFYRGENSNFQAYQQWIDTARKHNPNTIFFIGLTWPTGGGSRELTEFTTHNQSSEKLIAPIIAQLRQHYPDNRFVFLNYGPAAIELKRMFESGELPEIKAIEAKKNGLFKDNIGHAGKLIQQVSALLWLSAIYDTDLTSITAETPGGTDLNAVAAKIISNRTP